MTFGAWAGNFLAQLGAAGLLFSEAFPSCGVEEIAGRATFTLLAIWLILPVVIRLSKRLSHACLSINDLYGETAKGSL